MIFGEKEFVKIYDYIKANSKFDKFDLLINAFDSKLTRFANSIIHQNVAEKNFSVLLRGVKNNRVGVASVNSADGAKLDALIKSVETIISLKKEDEDACIVDKWDEIPYYTQFWNENTAKYTPERMAKSVDIILKKARSNKIDAFGAFEINLSEVFFANSFGLKRYNPVTMASVNVTAMGDHYSYAGLSLGRNCDATKLDFDAIGDEACGICMRAKNPRDAEPGRYDVILSHQAGEHLFSTLSFLGFSARSYQEGRSFLCGKLGTKICGDNITMWDDGLDANGQPMPFDFEGVKKEKVMLIENGVAKNLVYDTKTAKKDNKKSTGHALPATSSYGPLPWNLFVKPGDKSVDEMISSTKKGLLITSFHYVNIVNPRETTITGMTRNGTFMIEDGKVSYPIKNLRFTESICNALSNVEMLGDDPKLMGDSFGGTVLPTMKIKDFNFTSKTEF